MEPTKLAVVVLPALVACGSKPGVAPECRPLAAACGDLQVGDDFVDPVTHLGRGEGPTFVEMLDVVVAGDIVYGCTGTQGLSIWDAAGSGAPALLVDGVGPGGGLSNGSFPRCQHVDVEAESARVVITSRGDEVQPTPFVAIYDVSDPSRPVGRGTWTSLGSIEGAILEGDRVFVAAHTSGVVVLSASGAAAVGRVGGYADEASDAWQVIRIGTTLVAAEGATGLRTYDVSADDPQLLATVALPGSSRDVVVGGELAYVATSEGVSVVDISTPSAPVMVGEVAAPGTALALALGVDETLVVAEWDEVRGYSLAEPAAPRLVFSEVVPSDAEFSRVLGVATDPARRRIYAAEWRGLHAFEQHQAAGAPDIGTSPTLLQFGTVAPSDSQQRVLVVRNHGDRPLTVTDVVGSAGVTADTQCFSLEPNGAKAIEVDLAVSGTSEVDGALSICSDDPDEAQHVVSVSANVPGIDVGDEVPEFALTDLEGNSWTTADLRGNVAVLAYFATF